MAQEILDRISKRSYMNINPVLNHVFIQEWDVIEITIKTSNGPVILFLDVLQILRSKLSMNRNNSLIVGEFIYISSDESKKGQISLNLPIYIGWKRCLKYSSMDIEDVCINESDIKTIFIYRKQKDNLFKSIFEKLFKSKE